MTLLSIALVCNIADLRTYNEVKYQIMEGCSEGKGNYGILCYFVHSMHGTFALV